MLFLVVHQRKNFITKFEGLKIFEEIDKMSEYSNIPTFVTSLGLLAYKQVQ